MGRKKRAEQMLTEVEIVIHYYEVKTKKNEIIFDINHC